MVPQLFPIPREFPGKSPITSLLFPILGESPINPPMTPWWSTIPKEFPNSTILLSNSSPGISWRIPRRLCSQTISGNIEMGNMKLRHFQETWCTSKVRMMPYWTFMSRMNLMRGEMVGIWMTMGTMQETLTIQGGKSNRRGHVFCLDMTGYSRMMRGGWNLCWLMLGTLWNHMRSRPPNNHMTGLTLLQTHQRLV